MIRIWLTSDNGEGYVNYLTFDDLEDVKIFTDNIGKGVLITIEEVDEKEAKR